MPCVTLLGRGVVWIGLNSRAIPILDGRRDLLPITHYFEGKRGQDWPLSEYVLADGSTCSERTQQTRVLSSYGNIVFLCLADKDGIPLPGSWWQDAEIKVMMDALPAILDGQSGDDLPSHQEILDLIAKG